MEKANILCAIGFVHWQEGWTVSDKDTFELLKWKKRTQNAESSLEECIRQTEDVLPNLHAVFVVLLTMPVSVASAERSLSAFKRLKTYLRNTTGQ